MTRERQCKFGNVRATIKHLLRVSPEVNTLRVAVLGRLPTQVIPMQLEEWIHPEG